MKKLSQLLWATQGITHTINGYDFRAAPSAGALYPIETYLVVNRVENIEEGIYHYFVPEHSLKLLVKGDFSVKIAQAALDQDMVRHSAVVFVWTAVVERSKWKYRQRAYRYIYLDAGHLAENLFLAAESIDIGACGIGALYDEEINEMLDLNSSEETVVYMACVGHNN
jgi:SagB-type dehydrogenase family enzyme